MKYISIPKEEIRKRKTDILRDNIYNNFIYLANEDGLLHSKLEIDRLLNSDKVIFYLCLDDSNKIAGYILGEFTTLPDNRDVIYVTYLYVGEKYRKNGIGSNLLHKLELISKQKDLDGVLLTCNTEDFKVYDFYQKRGYMLDFKFRKYAKHDLVFKSI